MDQAARAGGQELSEEQRSPEQIQEEIEQAREELGETAEALAQKTDIKRQARTRLEALKQKARENPAPVAVGGAVLALLVIRRVRRRR